MTRHEITQRLEASGVVAIIRLKDGAALPRVVDALAEGGVRALEITMTVPGAVEHIRQVAATLPEGFVLGAGTVVDAETALRVADAGARFIVSPVFRTAVIEAAHRREIPVLPGCFSPTEILDAWDAGADIVKVFPATALGPDVPERSARAPAARQALPHRRRLDRQRRRLDSCRRRRGRRRVGARRCPGGRRRRLRADS